MKGVVLLARKKRFWFPGAIFHITARGNRRQNIFLNDTDRLSYLSYLKEVKEVHGFKLHAYCLMSNHVHLIIEINHSPPSSIIQQLHTKYSKYFNSKYEYTGHLFQGRYHDEIILNSEYFLTACKYVHKNPERANLKRLLSNHLWTSHSAYINNEPDPLVDTEMLRNYLMVSYEEFMKFQDVEDPATQ